MMSIIDENAFKKFEMIRPRKHIPIVEQQYIGDFETIFTLSNNERILYCELGDTWTFINSRDPEKQELTYDEWKSEFSRRLKNKLALKHIKQKELAEYLGVSPVTMNGYINGKRIPDVHTIRRISKMLECTLEELTNFDYLL